MFIPNFSFENPITNGIGAADSWVDFNNADNNAFNPFEFSSANEAYLGVNAATDPANGGVGYSGIEGSNVGFVFQNGDFTQVAGQAGGVGFQQTLAAVLLPHKRYTLTVAVGHRNGTVFGAPTLGSRIDLLAGSTIIASSIDNSGPPAGLFKDQSSVLSNSDTFLSLIGQPLTIRITTTLPTTVLNQATDWDNVRLDATAPVTAPEPASLLLLLLPASIAVVRRSSFITYKSSKFRFKIK